MGFERKFLLNLFSKQEGKKKNIPNENLFSKNEESLLKDEKSTSENKEKIDNSEPELEINEKRDQASSEVQATPADKEAANLNPEKKEKKKKVKKKKDKESKENKKKTLTQETEKVDPYSSFDYRKNLEAIKIKEGKIQKSEYRSFEKVSQDFKEEIKNIADSLVAKELDKNLNKNLQDLATKTGLPEETIKEIYKTQEESLIAEAKAEINKNTSTTKKIGIALGKSGLYVGAGILSATSTVASLGIGVGVGMGIIAGARILDRLVTEGRLKKKLDAKVREIKASKTDEDKASITQRFAAAISLKKQMEIDKVDLEQGGKSREVTIVNYLYDNLYNSSPQIKKEYSNKRIKQIENQKQNINNPKEKNKIDPKYFDNIHRSLVGLDEIDKLNNEREEKLNKITFFDKIKKIEDKISGTNVKEKAVSTSVFIGLGLAAREIPVIRQIIFAYAGYKAGGMIGNHIYRKHKYLKDAEIEYDENGKFTNYSVVKRKILDHDFQKNHPEEYLKLKKDLDIYENSILQGEKAIIAQSGIDGLKNNDLVFRSLLDIDKKEQRDSNAIKLILKGLGAGLGVITGSLISNLTKEFKERKIINNTDSSTSDSSGMEHDPSIEGTDGGSSNPDTSNDSLKMKTTPLDRTQNPKAENIQGSTDTNSAEAVGTKKFNAEYEAKYDTGFEDKISNIGLKDGQHDSVWRSTNQIFKDHAQDLGYKGDLNDPKALEAWSQNQTGNTLENTQHNINASGNPLKLHDKVFEGNKIVLKKNFSGNGYRITIQKSDGLEPGYLKHDSPIDSIPRRDYVAKNSFAPEIRKSDIQINENYVFANNLANKHLSNHSLMKLFKGIKGDDLTKDEKILVRQFNNNGNYDKNRFHNLMTHILSSKTSNQNETDNYNVVNKALDDIQNKIDGYDSSVQNVGANVGDNNISPDISSEDIKGVGVKNISNEDLNRIAHGHTGNVNIINEKISSAETTTKNLREILDSKGYLKSFDKLQSLPNNSQFKLGSLSAIKNSNGFEFTNSKGESFDLIVNKKFGGKISNFFDINKNGKILGKFGDSEEIKKALGLKKLIYNNLSDKKSVFGSQLLKDIKKDLDSK